MKYLMLTCVLFLSTTLKAEVQINVPPVTNLVVELVRSSMGPSAVVFYDSNNRVRLTAWSNAGGAWRAFYSSQYGNDGQDQDVSIGVFDKIVKLHRTLSRNSACKISMEVNVNTGEILKLNGACNPMAAIDSNVNAG